MTSTGVERSTYRLWGAVRVLSIALTSASTAYVAARVARFALAPADTVFYVPVPYGIVTLMVASFLAATMLWRKPGKASDGEWIGLGSIGLIATLMCAFAAIVSIRTWAAIVNPVSISMAVAGGVLCAAAAFALSQAGAPWPRRVFLDSVRRRHTFVVTAASVVGALALVSIALNGTPGRQSDNRDDARRLATLGALETAANTYYTRHKNLPTNSLSLGVEVDRELMVIEPYVRTSTSTYRLCARFDRRLDERVARELVTSTAYNYGETYVDIAVSRLTARWRHDVGDACFDREAVSGRVQPL